MGGHGGLNILPQKRWNVYNFENREKVRKDEEEAARQEQEAQLKARARDAEFRVEKLREIARLKKRQQQTSPSALAVSEEALGVAAAVVGAEDEDNEKPQHINLFAELEARERDEELKACKGDGASRREKGDGLEKEEKKVEEKGRRNRRGKREEEVPKANENERYELGFGSYEKSGKRPWYMTKSSLVEDGDSEVSLHADSSAIKNGEKRKKTIEELRAERIKREEQERLRANKVVSPLGGGPRRPTGFQNSSYTRRSHFQYNSGYGNSW